MRTMFFPPKQSMTKYHAKSENVRQKSGATPCLIHAHICAGKMGLLTHVIFNYYYGPYLEAVQTLWVKSRWEFVYKTWLSLPNPECPFLSRCRERVGFSVLLLVQHEGTFTISVDAAGSNIGCVLNSAFFSLEVFGTFTVSKLLVCADMDNCASRVLFSQYRYHIWLLKPFRKRPKRPHKRGLGSGWHPTVVEEI